MINNNPKKLEIMKRYLSFITTISLLIAFIYSSGQSTGNYQIQTKSYINEVQGPGGLPDGEEDFLETFTYMDGLGRTMQTVSKKLSPDQKDMVRFHVYDNYGRETKSYLSYADDSQDGTYKNNVITKQLDFYHDDMMVRVGLLNRVHLVNPGNQIIIPLILTLNLTLVWKILENGNYQQADQLI